MCAKPRRCCTAPTPQAAALLPWLRAATMANLDVNAFEGDVDQIYVR
jgi:hypothetical protein